MHSSKTFKPRIGSIVGLALLALSLGLARPPARALADAPDTRGPQPHSQGGMGNAPANPGGSLAGTTWRGVRELPPLASLTRGAVMTPIPMPQQQGDSESGPVTWLTRSLNPGNWILDAGMGIFAGIVRMFGGMAQKAATAFLGTASVLPTGCDNAATNFVFCTPGSLTYDHPGVRAIWGVLTSIAAGLVTILFTVRLGRMVVDGPRALAAEGKGLLLTFIVSLSFIQATGPICTLLIDFFNGLSNMLLSRASLAFPSQDVGDLNIGSNILFLVLWMIILLLILKSFARLVQIIILLAMAPIAGALLMDRATSARFRSWFEKLIELLLAQINLVIIFIVISAILQPYQGQAAGDAFVGFVLSIVMMGAALSGKSVIGIAASAIGGGGGGMLAFLRYQVAGSALRGIAGQRTAPTPAGSAGSRERAASSASSAQQSRSDATGDPARSAAAQRQGAPLGSFRVSDTPSSWASERASARYAAAAKGDARTSRLDARREQGRMRATLMRQQASTLRAQGETSSADTLSRKARLHDRFARGGDIARPSRFSDAERAQRRDTHQAALAEVSGMHALERDGLTQQIGADEQRLPIVTRELAMRGATGGNPSALHDEQRQLEQRLATSRARLQALTPGAGQQHAAATRTAAAALANERLPQSLRAAPYALRHGTDSASPFVRRIAGAPTQDARDALARSRAVAVTAAQTPAERRPPLVPAGQHGTFRRYRRAAPERPEHAEAFTKQPGATTRPSRARSQTIAMLRARRRYADAEGD